MPARDAYYQGFNPAVSWFLSAAVFGWHVETGLHLLRMVLAGVFDRHPQLRVVIGHMGEMLPFMLARVDDNLPPAVSGLDRLPSEYILVQRPHHDQRPVHGSAAAVRPDGLRRLLRAFVDWPYAPNTDGRRLLDTAPLSPADLERLAHGNAVAAAGLG